MKPKKSLLFSSSIIFAVTSFLTGSLHAQSGTWTGLTSGGNWTDIANWNSGAGPIADGSGNTADFSTVNIPAGAFTVNLAAARTIGNINFNDSDTSTAGTWNVAGAFNLTLAGTTPTITSNVATTIAPVIAGTAGLVKNGAADLTLTGDNLATFSGPITINAGIVRVASGVSQNAIGAVANTITLQGGGLAVNGSTGGSGPTYGAFTNPVVIAAGQTGTIYNSQRGAFNSAVTGSGTLNFVSNYVRGDVGGNWSGFNGTINLSSLAAANSDFRLLVGTVFSASSKLNITNASVYQSANPPNNAVGTTHSIGELSGTSAAFMGGSSVNGRFVNWQVGALNTDSEYAGVIANSAGVARLYKVGIGKLTLSGANTYTGDTQVNAGTLAIGNGGATGSLAATNTIVASGATLAFNRDNSAVSTYAGILSGAGSVVKRGTGEVNFTGVNSYTAGTTIEGGTIGINSASSLGDPAGSVSFTTADGGIEAQAAIASTRNFSVASGITATFGSLLAANSYDLSGTFSGAGSVAIGGLGQITFSGANTYGGSTTVNSGTFAANNTTGSATSTGAVTVTAGTLGGTGTLAGAVSVATGVVIKPGAVTPTSTSVGTLTTGSLALAGGTTINAEFASTSNYDKLVVTGTNGLTTTATSGNPVLVDLRAENSAAKWSTLGTYNLIQFAGTFSGTVNNLFKVTAASQQAGQTYTFGVSGNFITLTISGTAPSVWNVDNAGTWGTVGNWLNGIPSGIGISTEFGSVITAPRTVTLDTARTIGNLTFNNANAYTISGTPILSLDRTSGNTQTNILLGNHTISAPVQLTDSLEVFFAHATDSLTFTKAITGGGSIIKSSVGDLTLGAGSTFSGGVSFSNGTLTFANGGLGTGSSLTLDNATLVWSGGHTQDISNRSINFGDNSVTFYMDGNVTLANDFGFSGVAPLTKDGGGILSIGADATFSNNIVVLNGGLSFGTGGATGEVASNIALNGFGTVLKINRSTDSTVYGTITGIGDLQHPGTGATTLNGSNTFSGTTTIAAGSLVLGNPLALSGSTVMYDSLGGTIDFGAMSSATFGGLSNGDNGAKNLVLQNSSASAVALTVGGNNATTSYSGNLTGPGSFTKMGTGTLSLSGQNIITGAAALRSVAITELIGGGRLNAASLTVTDGATLNLVSGDIATTGNIDVINSLTGGAALVQTLGTINAAGSFNVAGNRVQGNLISLLGGSASAASMTVGRTGLTYTTEPLAGSTLDGLYINGGALALSGALTVGNTTTSNSSVNARMDAGTLSVGGVVSVGLNNGGRWSVLDINGGTFTSTEAVTGILLGLTTTGNSDFLVRGTATATVERIQLGQGTVGGTHVVRTADTGTLYVGAGGIVLGDATSVGVVRLTGGTLGAKAPWSSSVGMELTNTATIQTADAANTANNITLTGQISGGGSLTKTGGGTLTLGGTNIYSGDTTLSAGKLAINGGSIPDGGKLTINGGQVEPTGSETVNSLYFGAVQQAAGTWGATGSGAAHIDNTHFSGTGVVNVSTGAASGYATWSGANAGGQASNLDFDLDGVQNGVEFFMGATGSTFTANPPIVTTAGVRSITWPKSAAFAGTYLVKTSADLVVWTTASSGVVDNGTSVVYTLPTASTKLFVRLMVVPD